MACISVPTALLAGAAITGLGGLASTIIGSNAATTAAQTQATAANTGIAQTQAMYDSNKALLQPYVSAGTDVGLPGEINLLGGGSMDPATIQKSLEGLPGYKFALDQGTQSTKSAAAAMGLADSGSTLKGIDQYSTGLAQTYWQQYLTDFSNLAGTGNQAAGELAGVGSGAQTSINTLLQGSGAATAAGQVGSANSVIGGINSLTGGASNSALTLGLYNAGFFGNSNVNSLIPSSWGANANSTGL